MAMDAEAETAGARLEALLQKRGIGKADLARRLALRSGYQAVHKWTKGRGFSRRNQTLVERELGLPVGYFESAQREGAAPPSDLPKTHVAAWRDFLATPQAKEADPEHLRALAARRYQGTPSVVTYLLGLSELQSVQ